MFDTNQKVAVIPQIGKRVSLLGTGGEKVGQGLDPLEKIGKHRVHVDFSSLDDGSIAGSAAHFYGSQGVSRRLFLPD